MGRGGELCAACGGGWSLCCSWYLAGREVIGQYVTWTQPKYKLWRGRQPINPGLTEHIAGYIYIYVEVECLSSPDVVDPGSQAASSLISQSSLNTPA
jgi:hypothetical protein